MRVAGSAIHVRSERPVTVAGEGSNVLPTGVKGVRRGRRPWPPSPPLSVGRSDCADSAAAPGGIGEKIAIAGTVLLSTGLSGNRYQSRGGHVADTLAAC
jgi:hypothetical protein